MMAAFSSVAAMTPANAGAQAAPDPAAIQQLMRDRDLLMQQQREAAARETAARIVRTAQEPIREQRRRTTVVYPMGLSGAALNGATFLASKDAKTVAITATVPATPLSEFILKASAPLASDEPRSTAMNLDGLANKAKVGAEWRYGQQRLPNSEDAETLTRELTKVCLATNPPIQRVEGSGLEITGCDLAELQKNSETAKKLLAAYFPRTASWYLSLKGDLGVETFRFANATTFADDKEKKYPTSVAATFGYLGPSNIFFAASGRYDNSYEAAKTQAVCSIPALNQTTACPQKVVGPPTPKPVKATEFEMRGYLRDTATMPVGMAGIFRRDWEAKTNVIEVPLYVIKDKDGGLSGGVSMGYLWSEKPEETGPRFTVFVGQTFGLGGS